MTKNQAIILIESASKPETVFPVGVEYAEVYKKLLSLVHPDKFTEPSEKERASRVATKLGEFYGMVNGRVAVKPATLGQWIIQKPFSKGDIADLYLAYSSKLPLGDVKGSVLKIVRSEDDNDLMDAERDALIGLWPKAPSIAEPGGLQKYLPKLLHSFEASDRRVNVMTQPDGALSLEHIKALLPDGVPFRHIVWMMNRLLSLIGFSERYGIVHGGLMPDHLLYNPATHGLTVVGWCSAVQFKQPLRIVAKQWLEGGMYPQEVIRKWSSGSGTNIYMAAKSMLWAAQSVPHRFKKWFDYALASSPRSRPQDAWEAQDVWHLLAEEEYGKPVFVRLDLPIQ